MNPTTLLNLISSVAPQAAGTAGSAAPSTSSDPSSGAAFKSQFDQAVAALVNTAADASSGSSSASSTSASAGSTAGTPDATDALQADLQKKIADLLASGATIQQIVQQLATALAATFAQAFGGNPATIQTQLQTAFASALSPPSGVGPPPSTADLAASLAQRYRQIADLAAGVIGETGQSNRLFAGSFSDAALTAGGQPAPSQADPTAQAAPAPVTSDSNANDAAATLANLTAQTGDGKTVASNAPAVGSNGASLLGRVLTRAVNAAAERQAATAPTAPTTPAASAAPASAAPATGPVSPSLVDRTIAVASALLGSLGTSGSLATAPVAPAAPAASPSDLPAIDALHLGSLASITAAQTAATTPATTELAPAVSAFLKSFANALAATNGTALPNDTKDAANDGTATVSPTTVASAQAPTIGAFAPVAPAQHVDAISTNSPPATPAPANVAVDQNSVVEQVLRGAFLSTTGPTSIVRLKLVPETLGDVSVRLSITGSTVSANVVAQTPAAHDALVAGQAQLTRQLSDAGLKLTSFNVSLAGGFAGFQQQQQSSAQQQQAQSAGRLLLGDVDTTETDDASLAAIPNFAPSSTMIAGWGAFNYLV